MVLCGCKRRRCRGADQFRLMVEMGSTLRMMAAVAVVDEFLPSSQQTVTVEICNIPSQEEHLEWLQCQERKVLWRLYLRPSILFVILAH